MIYTNPFETINRKIRNNQKLKSPIYPICHWCGRIIVCENEIYRGWCPAYDNFIFHNKCREEHSYCCKSTKNNAIENLFTIGRIERKIAFNEILKEVKE